MNYCGERRHDACIIVATGLRRQDQEYVLQNKALAVKYEHHEFQADSENNIDWSVLEYQINSYNYVCNDHFHLISKL